MRGLVQADVQSQSYAFNLYQGGVNTVSPGAGG
jgi:hypothetical protein